MEAINGGSRKEQQPLLANTSNIFLNLGVSIGLNGDMERTFDSSDPGGSYCNQGLNVDIL